MSGRRRRVGRGRAAAVVALLVAAPVAACAQTATAPPETTPAPAPAAAPVYPRGAVATDHAAASEAGVEMLRLGGNAVDAAVAASFTLSVVRPESCGIGGGGFMLIHAPPATPGAAPTRVAINYRETSPVGPDHFVGLADETASRYGVHAVGVPGTVAGLLLAHDRHGRLDRATVLAPAIRAAETGFEVDAYHVRVIGEAGRMLAARPDLEAMAGGLWTDLLRAGAVAVGDRLRSPGQARALRLVAEHGAAAFYEGPIAEAIVAVMERHGGPITAEHLRRYRPLVTEPLAGSFMGTEVLAMPPPSSGGIATLQVLGLIERRRADIALSRHNAPIHVHLVAEAMKHAFADRAEWLADPAFVDVPVNRLLDPDYLDELAARIAPGRTLDRFEYGTVTPAPEDGGTSHISVVDARGMAVACTETINLPFGSLVEVPGFGFALNNEMDDFTTIPGRPNYFGLRQSDRNLPEPGKRPLSSMSPTIVVRRGRPILVLGGAGGPRIISGTIQVLLNSLLFDMPPREAVAAPRFHHQWMPDELQFERRWTDEHVIDVLAAAGHRTGRREGVGKIVVVRVDGDGLRAASDPRKGGRPAGH
ncbi:MAG: gamma-glutamyltransferase [Planctomycetota bacterium]